MVHSHEKIGGCSCTLLACLLLPVYVSMVDHTTAQMSDQGSEEFIICICYRGITVFKQQYICIWGCENSQ